MPKRKQQYEADYTSVSKQPRKPYSSQTDLNFNIAGFGKVRSNAYQEHQKLIQNYLRYNKGNLNDLVPDDTNFKTDLDIVHENSKFVWDDEDDVEDSSRPWAQRVAKKYWDQLNKEYVIGDLSRYKTKQYAFRWRTENEVIQGYGQFTCANKDCKHHNVDINDPAWEESTLGLVSFEVMFNYKEQDEKKSTLVKIRVCPKCDKKLNFHWKHKRAKEIKRGKREIELDEDIDYSDDDNYSRSRRRSKKQVSEKELVKKEEESGIVFIKKEEVKQEVIELLSDDETKVERQKSRDRRHSSSSRERKSSRKKERDYRDPFSKSSHHAASKSRDEHYEYDRLEDQRKKYHRKVLDPDEDKEEVKACADNASNIWSIDKSKRPKTDDEKRDEQFDDYLNDLLS